MPLQKGYHLLLHEVKNLNFTNGAIFSVIHLLLNSI